MQPAVFIDRDGVINRNPPSYVKQWEEFFFLPEALPALKLMAEIPWPIIIVTNQSVVGRGIIEMETLVQIHTRMVEEVNKVGGRIDGVYVCPHHPDEVCPCRKPQPGLLLNAANDMRLELNRSVLFGDSWNDAAAAFNAGVQPVLVWRNHMLDIPDPMEMNLTSIAVPVINDLMEAAIGLITATQRGSAPADVIYYLPRKSVDFDPTNPQNRIGF